MEPEKFAALVALIREPYATMVYTAIFTGLRVSELIGLRWRNVHADAISIEQRCCRGDWGAPKSAARNATIAVNRDVIQRLARLKTLVVEVKAGLTLPCQHPRHVLAIYTTPRSDYRSTASWPRLGQFWERPLSN